MARLHVVQAAFGESLLLEFGTPEAPRYILFDGGPADTYDRHLRPVLRKVMKPGSPLDLVLLTHVDNDHVLGLLDLFAELREQVESGRPLRPQVRELWHNSFARTIDPGGDILPRVQSVLSAFQASGIKMNNTEFTVEGILEGHQLRLSSLALEIPLNPSFPEGVILLENTPSSILFGDLSIQVLGPSKKSLERLRKKWLAWLENNEARLEAAGLQEAVKADASIPNLSSLMTLVEIGGKRLLLTGDGLGSDLLQGLKERGLLDASGAIHVDLLKLPHHGSARNVDEEFFQKVTADRYLISADGRYGNPDPKTLQWMVQNVPPEHKPFEIIVTNKTDAVLDVVKAFPPRVHGYKLSAMRRRSHALALEI